MSARCKDRRMATIAARGLGKSYAGKPAVSDLSFDVLPGSVTGFLGPNGAGKSTAMRLMLGLDKGAGETTFDGRRFSQLPQPMRHVGALLEAKPFHPTRTARNHLRMLAVANGIPTARVDEVLALVGLTEVARAKPRGFSMGMGQRLGLAAALLGDPHTLILDEPANGLDPAGIRWMRNLLRGYANRGGTVLLSSHLLHEIEVIADDLVVIGNGRVVAQGTKADLLAAAGTVARARDAAALALAMKQAGLAFTTHADGTVHTEAPPEHVGQAALSAHVVLTELRTADGAGLEETFLELTADTQREGAAA